MKRTMPISLLIAALALAMLSDRSGALEIFRIGGENLPPPPEASDSSVTFTPVPWSDFLEKDGFDDEAFAEEDILRPLFLTPEDNIALTSLTRGGGPFSRGCGGYQFLLDGCHATRMVDGDLSTFYLKQPYGYVFQSGDRSSWLIFDLGGAFSVNRVRLISTQGTSLYPDKLLVTTSTIPQIVERGSYGGVDPGRTVFSIVENTQDTVEAVFPTMRATEVGLQITVTTSRNMEIAEVEIYGEGFVNRASYVSKMFDLEEPAILGEMRWQGRKDPGVRIDIHSRSGKTLDPNVYWRNTGRGDELSRFDEKGKLLDAKGYAGLKTGEAAEITYDIENWSFWSPPYEFADSLGTSVISPSPNNVFQFRVDFQPDALQGGEVDFVEFSVTKPPLAQNVVGEVYPPEVPLGEISQLTYAVSPTMTPDHSGFDQIEIAAPFGFAGVDSVRATGLVDWSVQVESPDSTLFSVKLSPRREAGDLGGPVEVYFRAPVLRYGTPFDGWVRDSERPLELAQRINPGNAAPEFVSETLSVRTSLSPRLLADLLVEPRVFSPNGDGVNDISRFSLNLLQVTENVPLRLEIFDLSGRLLRQQEGLHESGRFSFSWNGRDDQQELVAPGLYMYRIVVKAKNGDDQQTGTIAVVY
ncbi:MAG: gliding motility-associated C-terminal domain-containing protein [Gemmatimonadota bacterium]|nr:gliding motility-associated C-terminal domain-containing protein [Gemmatimonadota bacterium]